MSMEMRRRFVALVAFAAITTGSAWAQKPAKDSQRFPDVVAAKVKPASGGTFDFDVTVSSLYDTPQRYADAFRVTTVDGKLLGERILLHDHQDEQPFTRDLHSVKIPTGIKKVLIQARDQKHGYGGKQIEVSLPGR
jgi:hypothetical protein